MRASLRGSPHSFRLSANWRDQLIRFEHVSFAYTQGHPVLSGVSVSVEPAQMVAVLGRNGSGKSTLVQLCNGLLLPSQGTVTVDGINTADHTATRQLREHVAVVFQRPDDQIVATSVEDDVAFGPENLGCERADIRVRVDAALAAVGLTGLERREPHLLSGGQKQRLAIAGALAMRPRYLVLDEPTSMLDPAGRAEVAQVIDELRASGHGVLLITHDLAEAARADLCVVLSDGETVFEGGASALFAMGDRISQWGLEVPPMAVLASRLQAAGVSVDPACCDPSTVVSALCR